MSDSAALPSSRSVPGILAGILLWILLAGYLIANKPFASLGVAPVYVGEITLAIALGAALFHWREAFLQPLQNSWGFRCLAALWLLGSARALFDARDNGLLALRDGAMIGYALFAVLVPFAWKQTSRVRAPDDGARLISHAANGLLPIGLLATVAAAGVLFDWWPRAFTLAVKVDFITLAAAVGGWVSFIAAIKWIVIGGAYSQTRKRDRYYRWVVVVFYLGFALWAATLIPRISTRSVLAAAPLLLLLLMLAFRRKDRPRAATAMVISGIVWMALAVYALDKHYAPLITRTQLTSNTRVDLNDLDARMPRVMAGDASALPKTFTGDFEYLVPYSESSAMPESTREHSVRWRIALWSRCWNCTLNSAPVFGFGFGDNLTALMLPTRAWKDYEDSQRLNPPNRSPHSIHVHLFARMGLLGTALWLAVLACVAQSAIQSLWSRRDSTTFADSQAFYDTLTVTGVWSLFLAAASFGVVIEGPFGGIWFWSLSGLLLSCRSTAAAQIAQ